MQHTKRCLAHQWLTTESIKQLHWDSFAILSVFYTMARNSFMKFPLIITKCFIRIIKTHRKVYFKIKYLIFDKIVCIVITFVASIWRLTRGYSHPNVPSGSVEAWMFRFLPLDGSSSLLMMVNDIVEQLIFIHMRNKLLKESDNNFCGHDSL